MKGYIIDFPADMAQSMKIKPLYSIPQTNFRGFLDSISIVIL